MVISVVGTSETTSVDATGRFRLVVTPSGNIQLRISGAGVDATQPLGPVTAGDNIEITIRVSGSSAEIEDTDRASGQSREIEGRVEAIPPATAAGSFKVAGKTILTTGATVFKMGDSGTAAFADVLLGARVHVKAAPTSGMPATVTATEVHIQNQQTQLPVNLNGTISGFIGSAAAFSFDIDGRHVIGGAFTEFNGNSAFADMANGKRAEVKAEYRLTPAQGLYATRIHVNK